MGRRILKGEMNEEIIPPQRHKQICTLRVFSEPIQTWRSPMPNFLHQEELPDALMNTEPKAD